MQLTAIQNPSGSGSKVGASTNANVGVALAISVASLGMIAFDSVAAPGEGRETSAVNSETVAQHGVLSAAEKDESWVSRWIGRWDMDTALLWYQEDGRVRAIEGVISATKALSDSESISTKLVLDSLSGPSASGAAAQQSLQTFTRPSGKGEYQVAAGVTPLDDTFQDTRVALTGGWQKTLDSATKVNAGLYGSKEYDYLSLGINGGAEWGFFKDNTTLSLSGALGYDMLDPVGGRPIALSAMAIRKDFATEAAFWQAFDESRQSGDGDKKLLDVMLGLTQILTPSTLMQLNYGIGHSSGYLTDPYKLVSLLNGTGNAKAYLYESRPDSRLKHSVFVLGKTAFKQGVAEYSYRFTTDDWGLDSHTLEGRYRHYLGDGFAGLSAPYIQLHLRAYNQKGVDFYRPYLLDDEALPTYVSADYRIGDMDTWTVGLKTGWRITGSDEMSLRLEYYQQQPRGESSSLAGLAGLDLYPSLSAILLQFGYRW